MAFLLPLAGLWRRKPENGTIPRMVAADSDRLRGRLQTRADEKTKAHWECIPQR